jgi:pimeloyl-ACP methyl ester carboxylesterase
MEVLMSVPETAATVPRPRWLPQEVWPFTVRYLQIDGQRVHYLDEGRGPVLLFVHAGMWSFVWRDLIVDLARDFRCVALDFPGSGLSDAPRGHRATLAGHARVLSDFVAQLRLDELVLVMHDLGGPIGLEFARAQPDLVRGLVVANSFGWWPPERTLRGMIRLMGSPAIRLLNTSTNLVPRLTATKFGVGRRLDRAGRQAFLGPTRNRRRRHPFHDLMHDAARARSLLEGVRAGLRGPLADRPLLTIFGERNDPLHFQRRWRGLFPTALQVLIPHGNHFPMCDAPDVCAEAVREWAPR